MRVLCRRLEEVSGAGISTSALQIVACDLRRWNWQFVGVRGCVIYVHGHNPEPAGQLCRMHYAQEYPNAHDI